MSERRQTSVWMTRLEDLQIRSILDTGFFHEFEMSPDIHSHAYYELLIGLDEGFQLELSDRNAVKVEAGSCFLIPPGVYHATGQTGSNSRKLAIRFEYMCSEEGKTKDSLYEFWDKAMKRQESVILLGKNGELLRAVMAIYEELDRGGIGHQVYLQALFTRLYVEVLRSLHKQSEKQNPREHHSAPENDIRGLKIEEYLYDHFAENITEEKLASELGLSSRQLDRVLQKTYKKSFRKLLVEIRLNRAVQLLLETDAPIEVIAERVGYTSLSGFYTAFQKMFSCSPSRFRKKIGK